MVVQKDRKKAVRILRIIQETYSDPFGGIGKPEPLNTSWSDVGQGASIRSIA